MPEVFKFTIALAACVAGMGWLALAMEVHWQQVRGARPLSRRSAVVLRVLGTMALGASLLACFWVDHATMAPLVWVMAIAGAALLIAFTLSWRPRWLGVLLLGLPVR
ncbi:DUF3325 domain-containing protein [Rhizobacter sp. J219]|uniref:DUF3325 domain-containing protein n=1 Tax=Rhizobacter sp. J219 TaxID=2898430 RepID=UPI0021517332|nr:DUF3325 domain-containing protein [Rhizobacter sp. J219]